MAHRIGEPCWDGGMMGARARLYLACDAAAAALICAARSAGDGARAPLTSTTPTSSSASLLASASISDPSLRREGVRVMTGWYPRRCCCCAAKVAARCAPRAPPSAPLGLRVAAAALASGDSAPSAVSSSSPSSSSSSSLSASSSLSSPSQITGGAARCGRCLVPEPNDEPRRCPRPAAPFGIPGPLAEPPTVRIAAAPRSSAAMSRSSRSTCSALAESAALTDATRINVSFSDAILSSSSAMDATPSAKLSTPPGTLPGERRADVGPRGGGGGGGGDGRVRGHALHRHTLHLDRRHLIHRRTRAGGQSGATWTLHPRRVPCQSSHPSAGRFPCCRGPGTCCCSA